MRMDVQEAIERRRSHRYYTEGKRIPAETLRELFRLASLSPSGNNLQPWEFILLQEPKSKQLLFDNGCSQKQVLTSSAIVIVLGNRNMAAHAEEIFADNVAKGYYDEATRQRQLATIRRTDAERTVEEKRVWTLRSTELAAMTLMLAATSLGIDTGPMEGYDHAKVRAAFGIPDDYEICMLISMGYRSKEPLPRQMRRPYSQIVHEERF
jgi:nitroreductase